MASAALLGAATPAAAQPSAASAWPAGRPIRIVVAYPAGGVSDAVARALADRLGPQLGATVVIENKAGASGSIGMDAVAKAAPDGYTLGFSAISPLALNPHLNRSPFDPARDIAPVASVMYSPVLLLATPATAVPDFKALLADAAARPGAVRWATSGQASVGHIVLEQVKLASRADITHVPYKGGGQQMTDALGGQFEILSTNAGPTVAQHIRAGKLRALAVGAPARLESLPNVPTLAELGFPAANQASVFGIFAPARTPGAVLQRLNLEINRALAEPGIRQRLVETGNVPTGGSAAAFAQAIAAESAANARIVQAARIQAE
ncbi:MAG: tripartite tricarboxylate transporter substrate binding protein [Xylophilus ampelinus]